MMQFLLRASLLSALTIVAGDADCDALAASRGSWVWNITAQEACWRPTTPACVRRMMPDAASLVDVLDRCTTLPARLSVAVLGDSQMFRLAKYLESALRDSEARCSSVAPPGSSWRCDSIASFYKLGAPADEDRAVVSCPKQLGARCKRCKSATCYRWREPNRNVPRKESAQNCLDCSTCMPHREICKFRPGGTLREWTVEYAPLEFSRDGALATALSRTSQQAILGEHFGGTVRIPDLVVFNAGLHDVGRYALARYESNMREYADLLLALRRRAPATRVVFVSTTAVSERLVPQAFASLTRNANIRAYNAAARRVMEARNVTVVDGYGLGADSPLIRGRDPVHKLAPFFDAAWRLVLGVVLGARGPRCGQPSAAAAATGTVCGALRYEDGDLFPPRSPAEIACISARCRAEPDSCVGVDAGTPPASEPDSC